MRTKRGAVALAAILVALPIPFGLAAEDNPIGHPKHHHYQLVDIGTFGGPNSSNYFGIKTLNSGGLATGVASTPSPDPYCFFSCFVSHAFLWQDGVLTDLGALPGDANSSAAIGLNSRGWVVGASENGVIDPLTLWPETDGVLWRDGRMTDLGTLGGVSSIANAVNQGGQMVGAALNPIPDSYSAGFPVVAVPILGVTTYIFPTATQSHAVLWQDGTMKDLGTLGGPDSAASFINDRGEIAGQSYVNSTPNPATGVPTVDPFFVGDDGKMVDIGSFGGTASYVNGLNNRGQVVGSMTFAGDAGWHPFLWDHGVLTDLGDLGFNRGAPNSLNEAGEVVGYSWTTPSTVRAFLWRDGVMTNLGTLGTNPCSEASSINSKGQIVGWSWSASSTCDQPSGVLHAFLWESGGPMVDLNTLIPPGSELTLGFGYQINDRGEISGDGLLPNGDTHAFVLIPCDDNHPGVTGCDYSLVDAAGGSAPPSRQPPDEPTSSLHPPRTSRALSHAQGS